MNHHIIFNIWSCCHFNSDSELALVNNVSCVGVGLVSLCPGVMSHPSKCSWRHSDHATGLWRRHFHAVRGTNIDYIFCNKSSEIGKAMFSFTCSKLVSWHVHLKHQSLFDNKMAMLLNGSILIDPICPNLGPPCRRSLWGIFTWSPTQKWRRSWGHYLNSLGQSQNAASLLERVLGLL